MSYRTEFHVHTRGSKDSFLGKYALLLMCKIRHVDCLAITDHNEVFKALEWEDFFDQHGIRIIVGEEIFSSRGEIVGLFLRERIPPNLTPEQTIERIRKQDGIVYVPHPYDEKRSATVLQYDALKHVAAEVDCIEIHNGRNISSTYDAKQEAIASKLNKPAIVGCDAHVFFEVGRNIVITEDPFDKHNFLKTLSTAKFQTHNCIMVAHHITKIVKLIKMICSGKADEVLRVVRKKLSGKS